MFNLLQNIIHLSAVQLVVYLFPLKRLYKFRASYWLQCRKFETKQRKNTQFRGSCKEGNPLTRIRTEV